MKKKIKKIKKQQKIIISLLSISILLSFAIMLKASITGYAPFGHSWQEITLPTPADATIPSGTAAAIWPSLYAEFSKDAELLEGKTLAEITATLPSGGGANCLWFFSGLCPSGWESRSNVNYKCTSTTYNPPGATCDNTLHPGNLCCSTGALSESCDGGDNDFDGIIDNGCDDDNDNYCDSSMTTVGTPPTCTAGGGDCDDTNPNVHPGATEISCNNIDENCNGYKADVDCDKYCVRIDVRPPNCYMLENDFSEQNCPQDYGWTINSNCDNQMQRGSIRECNDNDATINPGAPVEPKGDTVDRNCDTQTWHYVYDNFVANNPTYPMGSSVITCYGFGGGWDCQNNCYNQRIAIWYRDGYGIAGPDDVCRVIGYEYITSPTSFTTKLASNIPLNTYGGKPYTIWGDYIYGTPCRNGAHPDYANYPVYASITCYGQDWKYY